MLHKCEESIFDAPHGDFGITVNERCEALVFSHTAMKKRTRIPWEKLDVIAEYEIIYSDGEVIRVPLTYGGNICHFARRQNEPFTSRYYRHNGYCGTYFSDGIESKSDDGTPITLYKLTWHNPRPEALIASVQLITPENEAGDVVVTEALAII